ncbi:acetolactate decarboxylase [Acetobacterium sp.]|uniref:acetolactate decarboxylase n=1 Tax=Acetobacterium sp. TaxID=1872094 RepID=UPI002725FA7C|nr:acetolactate decarboxylase [Acetobacterium sp.]MDO9491182.1 acetolactate decarboxylase [Acetobacterium sp.]
MDQQNLFQVSSLAHFQNKGYDGLVSIEEMLSYGDTGFGTYHALNGEMIVLDGIAYRALGDCRVERATQRETTPFATLGFLDDEKSYDCKINGDIKTLMERLTALTQNTQAPVIARLTGVFQEMVVHGVWPVTKPYQELNLIIRKQAIYTFQEIRGRLVGVFCPPSANGLNVVGWHFHFLSDDLKVGGHVNDLWVQSLMVTFSVKKELVIIKP